MGYRSFLFATFLLFCSGTWTKEVIDTLESATGDRVIIAYTVTQENEKFVVKIRDAKKMLGQAFKNKYKKPDKVCILFFDKTGCTKDKTKFSGIETKAFMIPHGVNFKISEDGYYLMNDNPTLSLEVTSDETQELKIPIYLAHYVGKRHYEVFSQCENLVINLSKHKQVAKSSSSIPQVTTQTVTTQEELEGAFTDADEASILINIVSDLLNEQNGYPFTDELIEKHSQLREMSYRIKDEGVSAKIKEVLSAYKEKEDELKGEADSIAQRVETELKLAAEQEQARQDSIATVAQQQAEKEQKRNLWLIIGGVILAVLGFVFNQVIQHFRNVKNQKNIMAMQENVVKRAEDEAKRRTRNMARSQINHAKGDAKQKARIVINNGIGKIANKKKGNKGFSI